MLIEDKHCRQCQKVLQDQVKKEMEEKEKELSNGGMTEAQESTPKSLNMENIHKSELEKEMITLTPIVANTILPGLLKISEEDLRENVKTLGLKCLLSKTAAFLSLIGMFSTCIYCIYEENIVILSRKSKLNFLFYPCFLKTRQYTYQMRDKGLNFHYLGLL